MNNAFIRFSSERFGSVAFRGLSNSLNGGFMNQEICIECGREDAMENNDTCADCMSKMFPDWLAPAPVVGASDDFKEDS
jgi:hypothetical protein